MKVNYSYYEPNKGFEKIQAQIYNEFTKKYERHATASEKQIQQRYKSEKPDPRGIRFAFKDDSSPLAYIQTRVTEPTEENKRRTWIGYPWATEDCPEVQEKLYSEMFEYVKQRDPENEIVMGYISDCYLEPISFAKSKGYEIIDKGYQYAIDVKEASKIETGDFTVRIATLEDLDALLELCSSDPELKNAFPTKEAWISYFKDRVLPDGHTILLSKDNQLVCAGAPLKGLVKNAIIIRFSAVRPGFEEARKALIIEISKHNIENEWQDPLLMFPGTQEDRIAMLKKLGATIYDTQVLFGLTSQQK
ncbi:MAG: hypothetical protein ACXADY_17270 [Candidatus Hodarchaeales archaeon]|jgi:hypothetical protein